MINYLVTGRQEFLHSELKKLVYKRKYKLDLVIKKTLNWYQKNI